MKEEGLYKKFERNLVREFVYHLSELDKDEPLGKKDKEFFIQNYHSVLYYMEAYDWDEEFYSSLIQLIPNEAVEVKKEEITK